MPGIDQLISDRMDAFAGQPQALAQRYAQNQDLLDLLALQKMKTDKASAMRNVQASMQANPTTVRDQLEQEALTQTRQEMSARAMQGAQGMQLNQRRATQARGIPALSAPNMARMQRYQVGGIVPAEPKPTPTMGAVPPSAVGDEQIKQFAKEYMRIKAALEDPRQAEYKERNQLLLQDLIRQMGNEMPAVMQYIDSTKGMVEPRGFRDGGYTESRDYGMVYGPTDIYYDLRQLLGKLPGSEPITREQMIRAGIADPTGSLTPRQQEARTEALEQQIRELPPEERLPTPTPEATPAPAPIREPAGLGALVDRITAMPEQFRMKGTEPSGMRTPQDYLASLARQQARRREEVQEGAERPRSRYEEELDRLREEEGDLLGKITAMAQGIASGRGRSLGQSLAAGSAALTARERDIENRRLNLVEALQNAEITAEEAAREQRRLGIMEEEVQVQRDYNNARIAAQERVDAFAAQGDIQRARQAALEAAQEITSDLSYRSTIRSMIEGSEEARGLSDSELDSLVQEAIAKETSRLSREFMEQSGLPELEAAAQRLTPSVSADQFAADMQITE